MPPPPITPEQFAALPPEFQAILQAVINHYEARIAALESELAAARKTPRNSSLPPSSEHPHAKPPPQTKPKSKRKRGGQPGHKKHERALLPVEQCQQVVTAKPARCRRCHRKLCGHDPAPLRHQVWDLSPIEPHVSEYQRHRLTCTCGATTCAELPPGVPRGQAGPRLIALVTLLMGCFRQSKRRVALFLEQVLNQPCSPGWVVKLQNQGTAALRPCYDELAAQLPTAEQLSIDETPNKQGPDKAWLWTMVATTFTLFAFRTTRAATVLTELLGTAYEGVVNCDRAKMYFLLPRLQWCWAHLKRDFQALIDSRDGVKKRLGHDLLRPTRKMFALWARCRDGTLTRADFQRQMKPIRQEIEGLLLRGKFAGNAMADELWRHRERLWTFVDVEGVEPTNNASERRAPPRSGGRRHAVIWRKLSFGTQSESGSRFVETMLTVVETCRQQSRNAFAFVTTAIEAHLRHHPAPSLTSA